MLLHIEKVLGAATVKRMRAKLDAAEWTDGRETVGPQGAHVKRNLQLPETSPLRAELAAKSSRPACANRSFMQRPCRSRPCRHGSTATKAVARTGRMSPAP